MTPPDKPPPPRKTEGRSFGGHRGKRTLKHLRAVRGDGLLTVGKRKLAVSYQIDVYADGDRTIGSGSVDGDFTGLAEKLEGREANLALEGGGKVAATLENVEDGGAEIQLQLGEAGFPAA